MKFGNSKSSISRVRRAACLSAAVLLAAALSAPVIGAEPKEVGLEPVPVGEGPFYYDTAEQHGIRVDVLARGLARGYSFAFLPNGDALIVERGVRLRLLRNATGPKPELVATPVAGAPDFSSSENIHPDDVLGIQDVALHPNFANNQLLYYSYNRPVSYDASAKRLNVATVLARARLKGLQLADAEDLLVGEAAIGVGGTRILFGKDNEIFFSVGGLSTGDIESVQRTDNIYGKVLRVRANGTIPDDNPFVNVKGARAEIYTLGHRDPLGLAFERQSGSLIASEHGPQGGDELNRILRGGNYGWPKYTYGVEYGGSPLPTTPVGPGTEPPVMIWMPAIAPAGIAFYDGDKIPAWKDNLFIASARRGEVNGTGGLVRVVFNDRLQELRQETLLGDLHQRFKDVRQGPDGLLYALTDEAESVLLRIGPAGRVLP
jgi:glucose/arabinose dehydrogenase